MKIVLAGNPNVGKSVLFSRLTGARVIVSNYPGTTVGFTKGKFCFLGMEGELYDAPGTYSLNPTSKAEEVAVNLIKDADLIVNVIDSTNLERNLLLTLELVSKIKKPFIVVLNMWDETKHKGVEIDIDRLKEILGIEVVSTCGLTGEGIVRLIHRIKDAKVPDFTLKEDVWSFIGEIIRKVQKLHHRHHSFWDAVQELSIKPPWAWIIALLAILSSFQVIRFIGEGFINYVFDPFFMNFYTPLIMKLSALVGEGNFIHSVLIGHLIDGRLDYALAFGVLTTGFYVPIAMVLPYVFSFYLVLGFLEDLGYLPRLAVLFDRVFHKIGLHGYSIVPMVLGLGCNVPGALSTRLFEERREKFIAATLLAIAVPCMAQTSMIIGILGRFGGQYVGMVFFNLVVIWFILGKLLNRFLKGCSPEILLEIPPYRRPSLIALFKKLWIRLRWFFSDAFPYVLLGVLLVNILYYFKIIDFLACFFNPLIRNLWGLPQESIGALIVGFLRKDVAVGMLRPLNLTIRQLIIGSTILAVYFPCVATFMVLLRELGVRDMIKSMLIMIATAVITGTLLNLILFVLNIG